MPYLIGPNSAAIAPNRNSAANKAASEWSAKPALASAVIPISTSLRRRATTALSKRSASWPPRPERKKNGAMKTAPANVISASASWPPILNKIKKTSAFLRKLSLKAEKNWHQNSGAKRRDVIRDVDTVQILWRSPFRKASDADLGPGVTEQDAI